MSRKFSLSIIIPVYNEESHIGRCLDAIALQTSQPLEVVIVDNNCTDKTIKIAKTYNFVRVVREKKQGRGAARTAGFNAARGDILGRIDADSVVAKDWVERAVAAFDDPEVVGVTGLGRTNALPWVESIYMTLWSRLYFWAAHARFRAITMWGANMAIRRTAWEEVKHEVNLDDTEVHEDQDVSMLLISRGGKIIQDDHLLIRTKGQTYFYWPKFWEYVRRSFKTKKYHDQRMQHTGQTISKLGLWHLLPGALLASIAAIVFIVVSFSCWPITATLHRLGRQSR